MSKLCPVAGSVIAAPSGIIILRCQSPGVLRIVLNMFCRPAHALPSARTDVDGSAAFRAKYTVTRPPPTRKTTCITSVHATALSPPYIEYRPENTRSPTTPHMTGTPSNCSMAIAPSHATEVRFMNMYRSRKNIEKAMLTPFPYLSLKSCGMVYIFFCSITGRRYFATTMSDAAAIHS